MILKAIGVFFAVFIGITAIGYISYLKYENPIHLLVFTHLGLILGIIFSKRSIPKKVIPHKNSDVIND